MNNPKTMTTEDAIIGAIDHRIKKLEDRYPFTADELEILCRCHDQYLQNPDDPDDFLMILAKSSPYKYFMLPGDEMRTRVNWIRDKILPAGFPNQLRVAMFVDAFVEYANQGEGKTLERFLEGVADTGRRGSKEALRFLYRLVDDPKPEELIDFCLCLTVASELLVAPVLEKDATLRNFEQLQLAKDTMTKSLQSACAGEKLTCLKFIGWAEASFPMLHAPLTTFVHRLLFHGHPFPSPRVPYVAPHLDKNSRVLASPSENPLLTSLSMTATNFGGKWHRVYSSFEDGRSFNRLEYALLGYTGPTVILVETTAQHILGAYASQPWKDTKGEFYGDSDCFLFELRPNLKIYRNENTSAEQNFMYMHMSNRLTTCHGHPHGLGFGGSKDHPRFFIPESFQQCSAGYLDKTFEEGELLPMDDLETFEIKTLEVWGVGGETVIQQAMKQQAAFRARRDEIIRRARQVYDKKIFAEDMQSGLIPNLLYAHQERVRGRHEFVVDEKHGGYKIEEQ